MCNGRCRRGLGVLSLSGLSMPMSLGGNGSGQHSLLCRGRRVARVLVIIGMVFVGSLLFLVVMEKTQATTLLLRRISPMFLLLLVVGRLPHNLSGPRRWRLLGQLGTLRGLIILVILVAVEDTQNTTLPMALVIVMLVLIGRVSRLGLLVPVFFGGVSLLFVRMRRHGCRGRLPGVMLVASPVVSVCGGRLLLPGVPVGEFRGRDASGKTSASCEARVGPLVVGIVGAGCVAGNGPLVVGVVADGRGWQWLRRDSWVGRHIRVGCMRMVKMLLRLPASKSTESTASGSMARLRLLVITPDCSVIGIGRGVRGDASLRLNLRRPTCSMTFRVLTMASSGRRGATTEKNPTVARVLPGSIPR